MCAVQLILERISVAFTGQSRVDLIVVAFIVGTVLHDVDRVITVRFFVNPLSNEKQRAEAGHTDISWSHFHNGRNCELIVSSISIRDL